MAINLQKGQKIDIGLSKITVGLGWDPNEGTGHDFDLDASAIMIDENMPKIFGLNTVDFTKQYYVVEGAIDSLFLNNAIAMAGADGNMSGLEHSENCIIVFDAEYRNKEIIFIKIYLLIKCIKIKIKLIIKKYNYCNCVKSIYCKR